MINIRDEADVQIWCDYQEETKQTNTNFFLRLRFANFRIFIANANNYGSRNGMDMETVKVLVLAMVSALALAMDLAGDGDIGSGTGNGSGNNFQL